jgi:calcineurin-like phosphoesterase family protein
MELLGRPFKSPDHQLEKLIKYHNKIVSTDDLVVVIGDVCNKDAPSWWLQYVSAFNGKKILIRGNHDKNFTDDELLKCFEVVVPDGGGMPFSFDGIDYYATHYPTSGVDDKFNLVGHIHGGWRVQLNMLNVGVDVHNYRPVSSDRLKFYVDAVTKYYDEDMWVAYNPLNTKYKDARGKKDRYFKPVVEHHIQPGPFEPEDFGEVEEGSK